MPYSDFQLQEWLQKHDTLPLPELEEDDTIFEFMVGDNGEWEHWEGRVCTL